MSAGPPPGRPGASALGATALVAASAMCFGTISILTVLATRRGATLLTVLAGRYAITAVAIAALAALRPAPGATATPRARAWRLAVVGGVAQAAIAFLTLRALDYISAASLVFLFYSYPAWVALIAAARRIERVDRWRAAALALSLGGIVVMVGAPGAAALHPAGAAFALAGAVLYGIFIPLVGRMQEGLEPDAVTLWVSVGAGAALAAAGVARGELALRLPAGAWAAIAALAILCTVIAFRLFLRGLARLGPVRTAIVSTVEPFWTSLLGALILSQPVGGSTVLGGTLIATAVVLLQLTSPRTAAPRVEHGGG